MLCKEPVLVLAGCRTGRCDDPIQFESYHFPDVGSSIVYWHALHLWIPLHLNCTRSQATLTIANVLSICTYECSATRGSLLAEHPGTP